jgi:adhesin/invasin
MDSNTSNATLCVRQNVSQSSCALPVKAVAHDAIYEITVYLAKSGSPKDPKGFARATLRASVNGTPGNVVAGLGDFSWRDISDRSLTAVTFTKFIAVTPGADYFVVLEGVGYSESYYNLYVAAATAPPVCTVLTYAQGQSWTSGGNVALKVTGQNVPKTVTIVAGDNQSTQVGTTFPILLEVEVLDAVRDPVVDNTVWFTATPPMLHSEPGFVHTDSRGRARTQLFALTKAGSDTCWISTLRLPGYVYAKATVLPGPVASLTLAPGSSPQRTMVNTPFASPLKVFLTDKYDNAVPNAPVTFTPPSNAVLLDAMSTSSDGMGAAWVNARAGATPGRHAVLVETLGGLADSFDLTVSAAPAGTIVAINGSLSSTVGQLYAPLTVEVRDTQGQPKAGVVVRFTAPESGPSVVLGSRDVTTGANGRAQVTATANTHQGPFSVVASTDGVSNPAVFSLSNLADAPYSLQVVSGHYQTAVVGELFTTPLQFRLKDRYENPIQGVALTFESPGTGTSATLSPTQAITNSDGLGSTRATANTVAGSYEVTAHTSNVQARLRLINIAGQPVVVAASAGAEQLTEVTKDFTTLLEATVSDAYGNAVSGVRVTFVSRGGTAAAQLTPSFGTTDGSGKVSSRATANKVSGTYLVEAATYGASSANYGLTNTPGPAADLVASASSTPQTVRIGDAFQPLVVSLMDVYRNPIFGATVNFAGDARFVVLGHASAVTDLQGQATVTATATTLAGSHAASASIGTLEASFQLANSPDAPGTIVAINPTLSTTVGMSFGAPLEVEVRDGSGNVVPNVLVSFETPATGPSVVLETASVRTDSNGRGRVKGSANTKSGRYQVQASVDGAKAAAVFSMTNVAGAPIRAIAGPGSTPQSTVVAMGFASPLVYVLLDGYGNGVEGLTVSVTSTSSGAGASFFPSQGVTDDQGRFETTATANLLAGTYVVQSVGSHFTVDYRLTNLPGAPVQLAASSGSTQSSTVPLAFPLPLEVQVLDDYGNGVGDVSVVFLVPGSGPSATLTVEQGVTGPRGTLQTLGTANTLAGKYDVQAYAAGVLGVAYFSLENLPGAPATLRALAGSTPQSSQVGTAFANPLAAKVSDRYGNAIGGTVVLFQAPSGDVTAAVSPLRDASNADGVVSSRAVASARAGSYAVTAVVEGLTTVSTTFQLTNTAGIPRRLVARTGGQQATVGQAFPQDLTVFVGNEAGAPVPDITVRFSAPGAGPSANVIPMSAVSDGNGLARVSATANGIKGNFVVTATADEAEAPATFELTNLAGAPTRGTATASSTPQSTAVETLFAELLGLQVQDSFGNGVPGVVMDFAVPTSGASADLFMVTPVTDDDGRVTVGARANGTKGTYTVKATSAAIAVDFSLTNLVGEATSIEAVTGTPQRAKVAAAFAVPLTVRVRDTGGNPVPNAWVTYVAPTTGPTAKLTGARVVTNAFGEAQVTGTANTQAGSYEVRATVGSVPQSAVFSLTNEAAAAAKVVARGTATPQAAKIRTRFSQPLAVLVADVYGNPVAGIDVAYDAPVSGATAVLAQRSDITGPSGEASVAATASSTAGSYRVTASVAGLSSTVFSLSNLVAEPSTVVATGGSPQSAAVDTTFTVPLEATVLDQGGNAVQSSTVSFLVLVGPRASASFRVASVSTTAAGKASTVATANAAGGSYSVVAVVEGSVAPAEFALTNLPRDTRTRLEVSPMQGAVGTPLQLTVTVESATGTPTGLVRIFEGAVPAGELTLQGGRGTLVLQTQDWSPGNHLITAAYDGDEGSLSSVSDVVTVLLTGAGDAGADAAGDAGSDASSGDAGPIDAGQDAGSSDAGQDGGGGNPTPSGGGCGCHTGGSSSSPWWAGAALLLAPFLRRRRLRYLSTSWLRH